MRLIQVSAHMQKCTALWIAEQVRHVVIILLTLMGVFVHKSTRCHDTYNWIYGLHGDDTGIVNFFLVFFFVLVNNQKESKCQMAPWVCKTGVFC